MAPPRLYGATHFTYDPVSEGVIVALVGANGVDPVSIGNGLLVETTTHARIEAGNTFVHNNVHNGIAAGASYWHVLTTGAKELHLTIYSSSSDTAPIWVEITESPTFTGGTAGTFVNKNRTSANTASASIVEGATVTVNGTHLEGDFSGGTKQSGGNTSIEEEWILKPSTSYGFLIRNDATGAANISFHVEFYEV